MTVEEKRQRNRGYSKTWKKRNPEKALFDRKNAHLKMKYGITFAEYNEMLAKQNGCCAICGKSPSGFKRKFHVDHDHATGKIRGLLCVRCNFGLGYFEENPLLLDSAKKYITDHSTVLIG